MLAVMEQTPGEDRWSPTPKAFAWTAAGLLLLPAGIALLAYAGGLFGTRPGAEVGSRVTAFDLGMLCAALGNWSAPLALSSVQLALSVPEEEGARQRRLLVNPWVMLILLPGLAFVAARSLREPISHFGSDQLGNMLLPAVLLGISALSRVAFAADVFMDRRQFGATSFPKTLKCAPGREAVAVLVLGKPAESVAAKLELYVGDGDPKEYPATVAAPVSTPDGWSYRVSAPIPASPVPTGEDDGWSLSVEAKGAAGARHFESVDIELAP
jgi:hypothetical protein